MYKTILAALALATASGAALAHPGHADQGIHLAEWLMGAAALAGSVLALRALRRRARGQSKL
jgi:hypothetical protein